jgi:hypothetical protein
MRVRDPNTPSPQHPHARPKPWAFSFKRDLSNGASPEYISEGDNVGATTAPARSGFACNANGNCFCRPWPGTRRRHDVLVLGATGYGLAF